jgi:hypothetical protein
MFTRIMYLSLEIMGIDLNPDCKETAAIPLHDGTGLTRQLRAYRRDRQRCLNADPAARRGRSGNHQNSVLTKTKHLPGFSASV